MSSPAREPELTGDSPIHWPLALLSAAGVVVCIGAIVLSAPAGAAAPGSPPLASAAKTGLVLVYVGTVLRLALSRGAGWMPAALVTAPAAAALGLLVSFAALPVFVSHPPQRWLALITECALPLAAAALAAPIIAGAARGFARSRSASGVAGDSR